MDDGFYSYAELEAVLAMVFDAQTPTALPRLRARYKKLQGGGIPYGERPKRGERTKYILAQVAEIALAFEMLELGVDLSVVCDFFRQFYVDAEKRIEEANGNALGLFSIDPNLPIHPIGSLMLSISVQSGALEGDLPHFTLSFDPAIMSKSWNTIAEVPYWIGELNSLVHLLRIEKRSRLAVISLHNLAFRIVKAVDRVKGVDDGDDPKA